MIHANASPALPFRTRWQPPQLSRVELGGTQEGGERPEIEDFVRRVFADAYGARLRRLMPILVGMRGPDAQLTAALGIRVAAAEPLFLERYLAAPIEQLLTAHASLPVQRSEIVELGNLAAIRPGASRRLILEMAVALNRAGIGWVSFTITPTLVNSFQRLGLNLIPLGMARKEVLTPSEQRDWGSYYENGPRVYAAHIEGGLYRVRELLRLANDRALAN